MGFMDNIFNRDKGGKAPSDSESAQPQDALAPEPQMETETELVAQSPSSDILSRKVDIAESTETDLQQNSDTISTPTYESPESFDDSSVDVNKPITSIRRSSPLISSKAPLSTIGSTIPGILRRRYDGMADATSGLAGIARKVLKRAPLSSIAGSAYEGQYPSDNGSLTWRVPVLPADAEPNDISVETPSASERPVKLKQRKPASQPRVHRKAIIRRTPQNTGYRAFY